MIVVNMQGALSPTLLDMTEGEFLADCNMAALQGKEFVLGRKADGHIVGINVRNILTFEEAESADLLG